MDLGSGLSRRWNAARSYLLLLRQTAQLMATSDEIKGAPQARDYPLAKKLLERIECRHWIDLSESGRIRLLSQKGFIHLVHGDQVAAAREYLRAVRIAPTTKTRTDEALAYELIDDAARAHALRDKLIADFPLSPRPLAIWLRTSPSECSAESQGTTGRIESSLRSREVWLAVAAPCVCPARLQFVPNDPGDRVVKLILTGRPDGCFLGFAIGGRYSLRVHFRPTRLSTEQQERLRLAASHFESRRLGGKGEAHSDTVEALVGLARARSPGEFKASEMPCAGRTC